MYWVGGGGGGPFGAAAWKLFSGRVALVGTNAAAMLFWIWRIALPPWEIRHLPLQTGTRARAADPQIRTARPLKFPLLENINRIQFRTRIKLDTTSRARACRAAPRVKRSGALKGARISKAFLSDMRAREYLSHPPFYLPLQASAQITVGRMKQRLHAPLLHMSFKCKYCKRLTVEASGYCRHGAKTSWWTADLLLCSR